MTKSPAKGAQLAVKNGASYNVIAGLGDFNFPEAEVQIEDVTTHDSAANTEEMLPTIFKSRKISAPMQWDDSDTDHQFLLTSNGTAQAFGYTGTGHTTQLKFNAIIGLQFENPVKGSKKATLTLTVSDGSTPS